MLVYVISSGDYSDYQIIGIVSSREKFDLEDAKYKEQGLIYPYECVVYAIDKFVDLPCSVVVYIDGNGKVVWTTASPFTDEEPGARDRSPKDISYQGKYPKPWRRDQLRYQGTGKDLEQARRVADEFRKEDLLTREWEGSADGEETTFPKDWNRG